MKFKKLLILSAAIATLKINANEIIPENSFNIAPLNIISTNLIYSPVKSIEKVYLTLNVKKILYKKNVIYKFLKTKEFYLA